MDKKPFFTFDLQSHDEGQVQKLAGFQRASFSIEAILEAASSLKYTSKAAAYIKKQLATPDDEFLKLVGRQIYEGSLTKAALEQIRPAIQGALDEVIRDRIQDKLNVAFRAEAPPAEVTPAKPVDDVDQKSDVVTTDDENQAFMIIRAISSRLIDVERITLRDSKSYCSVFVDDNNRKPVCRFYFNAKSVRSVGVFDDQKVEERIVIEKLSEIYALATKIEKAISAYL